MRKSVKYDKKYLQDTMRYSKVPVRQIHGLDLSLQEQALLVHLFSHDDYWGISINQMSKSFGRRKNRKNIKDAFENIKRKGYIVENPESYLIDLDRIQKDYFKNQNIGNNSRGTVSENNNLAVSENNNNMIAPLTGDVNQVTRDTVNPAHTNNINNNIKKENKEVNQSINQLTHLEAIFLLKSIKIHEHVCKPDNDLKLLLQESYHFSVLYKSNKWCQYDINNLSNNQIANLAYIYITNKEKFFKYKDILYFISVIMRHSYKLSREMEISKEFEKICLINNEPNILETILLE